MNTGIVILAAGESSRMGAPKQLLTYHGTTLLQHAIDTARELDDAAVVAVLGAHAEQILPQLDAHDILVVENPDWPAGMGGSLRTGLRALLDEHPDISAVIFLLCDQPLLSATTLENLVAAHESTGSAIVASEYDGILGVPALFTRTFFPDLLALEGAAGARQIIWTHRAHAIGVPFSEGAVDIDTPADYARLQSSPSKPSTLIAA